MRWGVLVVPVLSACPAQPEATRTPPPVNQCSEGACTAYQDSTGARCIAGVCAASKTRSHFLSVTLPHTSSFAPDQTFVLSSTDFLKYADPSCPSFGCLLLPRTSSVEQAYVPTPKVQREEVQFFLGNVDGDVAGVAALPVRAVFTPLATIEGCTTSGIVLGLHPNAVTSNRFRYDAERRELPLSGLLGPSGSPATGFEAELAPGTYIRQIVSESPFDVAYPPDMRTMELGSGAIDRTLIALDAVDKTSSFAGGPKVIPTFSFTRRGGTLSGFTTVLREIFSGEEVSGRRVLGAETNAVRLLSRRGTDALFETELVLRPPAGAPLPSLQVLQATGIVENIVYPELPDVVSTTLRASFRGVGVSGSVALRSLRIVDATLRPYAGLSYEVVWPLRDGTATGDLPPGEYETVVLPDDVAQARRVVRIVVSPGIRAQEEAVELAPSARLQVSCKTTAGEPLRWADVVIRPAVTSWGVNLATCRAKSADPPILWPRARWGSLGEMGEGTFLVDTGNVEVTIRPREGTRLPWIVRSVRVEEGTTEISDCKIPLPVSAGLVLRDPNRNPIRGAVVRAFAPAQSGGIGGFLEIGQALTNRSGAYDLYLAPE